MNSTLDFDDMDFDAWLALARQDPDQFEEKRAEVVNKLIESAPDQHQRRLRGLQWRVDQERRLARNPIDSCIRISQMMWDNVSGSRGMLENFRELNEALNQLGKTGKV